jgi:hypothetical protein
MKNFNKAWAIDTGERVIMTFLETFFAALFASGAGVTAFSSATNVEKAAVAGLAAVIALVKAILAAPLASTTSPASLAPSTPATPTAASGGGSAAAA